jgi:hypothetical protein
MTLGILDENSNEKNQSNDQFDEFDLDNEYEAFTFD